MSGSQHLFYTSEVIVAHFLVRDPCVAPGHGHVGVTVASPLPSNIPITNADYGVTCAEGVGASGDVVTTRAVPRGPERFNTYLPIILKQYQ